MTHERLTDYWLSNGSTALASLRISLHKSHKFWGLKCKEKKNRDEYVKTPKDQGLIKPKTFLKFSSMFQQSNLAEREHGQTLKIRSSHELKIFYRKRRQPAYILKLLICKHKKQIFNIPLYLNSEYMDLYIYICICTKKSSKFLMAHSTNTKKLIWHH